MAHRDVAIAVSGILVGALLGAGVVLYANQGSGLSAYLLMPEEGRHFFGPRASEERGLSYPGPSGTWPGATRAAAPELQADEAETPVLDCLTVEILRDAVMDAIPASRETLLALTNVESVFDEALAVCEIPGGEMMLEDMEEVPAVRPAAPDCMDPNYCSMYSGTRRTRCIVEQTRGICYQPGQIAR